MEYIYLGKIVNTHGIKGEIRILSDFRYKEKVFIKDFPIYIGKKHEKEIINTYRPHKSFDMITMKGYTNINEVLKYKSLPVYIKREDLKLANNEFLDEDLIGLPITMNGEVQGIVEKVIIGRQDKLLVKKGEKEYYIPYVKGIIKKIIPQKEIIIENISGLFD